MLIAKSWYEDSSFWQFAITTLVAVSVGALGALATVRASNPKRRLVYRTLANTSLFVASHSATGALSVQHGATPVSRPRVIELEFRNAGRHDITPSQFSGGSPIVCDLGADVVAVLDVSTSPAGSVRPPVTIASAPGSAIEVGACLLQRKQVVRISVLVDGPQADVQYLSVPLIDVDRREGEVFEASIPVRKFLIWLGVLIIALLIGMPGIIELIYIMSN
ncbi:hypothetical protein [Streptomyces olivaceus]|uniref:hypothetical protein n=1 Tax=Streptomyces olivaceus TaxID=47716 RepID=UPI0022EF2190|nr:hypothetical protein [Streptomyces olivaceus]GHI96695.1 hypothetical protein TPA0905_61660 [Streptomyces olivaceus]